MSEGKSAVEIVSDVLVRDAFVVCEHGRVMDNFVTILPGGKTRVLVEHGADGPGVVRIRTTREEFFASG